MKTLTNILISLLLSLSTATVLYAQDDEGIVEIKTDIYHSIFNERYQQPLVVEYTIFCKPESPSYERDGISFKAYPGLIASSNSDYSGNVYDKGHMAPAKRNI